MDSRVNWNWPITFTLRDREERPNCVSCMGYASKGMGGSGMGGGMNSPSTGMGGRMGGGMVGGGG